MIEEFGEPYHDATNNHSPEDRKMLYAVSDSGQHIQFLVIFENNERACKDKPFMMNVV
jgi:hypothetical protein